MGKEDQSDETKIAIMQQDLSYVRRDMTEMKNDIKIALNGFASKEYVDEKIKSIDGKYAPVRSSLIWAVTLFGGVIVTAIAAFLVKGGFN